MVDDSCDSYHCDVKCNKRLLNILYAFPHHFCLDLLSKFLFIERIGSWLFLYLMLKTRFSFFYFKDNPFFPFLSVKHPFSNYQIHYKFFWPIFINVSIVLYVQTSIDVSYFIIDQILCFVHAILSLEGWLKRTHCTMDSV